MKSSIPKLIHVIQGEFAVSMHEDQVLTTVLGSCVAVCLWDGNARVGGMNHFLLPGSKDSEISSARYGACAMERLINEMLKLGATRDNLKAKVFGGSKMSVGLNHIGGKNVQFARTYLGTEGIPVLSESLGGNFARRIRFWPTSGRVQQMVVETMELDGFIKAPSHSTYKARGSGITLFSI